MDPILNIIPVFYPGEMISHILYHQFIIIRVDLSGKISKMGELFRRVSRHPCIAFVEITFPVTQSFSHHAMKPATIADSSRN